MVSQEEIEEAIKMMADENAKEFSPAIAMVVDNILNKGMLPMDAIGMDHKTVEASYMQAVHLYNTAQYIEAARAFHALTLLHPAEVKFQTGLAACYHMLEEYDNALTVYAYVTILDPESPIPHYHASDCYTKLEMPAAAVAELQIAMELCGEQPQYAMIKDRSQIIINAINEKEAAKPPEEKEKAPTTTAEKKPPLVRAPQLKKK